MARVLLTAALAALLLSASVFACTHEPIPPDHAWGQIPGEHQ